MKAKTKLLWIMAAVLMLLLAGMLLADRLNAAQTQQDARQESISLTDFSGSEILAFGYTWQGQTLRFVKKQVGTAQQQAQSNTEDGAQSTTKQEPQEQWCLADEPEYQIDQTTVSTMLTAFSTLTAQRRLDETSEDFGLADPTLTFWVSTEDKTLRWTVGEENQVTGTLYLQQEGEQAVYMVWATSLASLQKTKAELAAGSAQEELEETEDADFFGSQAGTP